jgi:hypothetical protein
MNEDYHTFILLFEFSEEAIENLSMYHNVLCMDVFDTFLQPEDVDDILNKENVCNFLKLIIVKQIKYFRSGKDVAMSVRLDRNTWQTV